MRYFLPAVVDEIRQFGIEVTEAVIRTGDLRRTPAGAHRCRMFGWREILAMIEPLPCRLLAASASNATSLADPRALEWLAADTDRWERYLAWEEELAQVSEPMWDGLGAALAHALAGSAPSAGPMADLDAGRGLSTVAIADALPTADILAVEPLPSMRAVLLSRLRGRPDLRTRVSVVAATVERAELPSRRSRRSVHDRPSRPACPVRLVATAGRSAGDGHARGGEPVAAGATRDHPRDCLPTAPGKGSSATRTPWQPVPQA